MEDSRSDSVNLKWYEKFSFTIVVRTENFFYSLGYRVASRPVLTIILCWTFVIMASLGFLRFRQEKNPMKLWVPSNSEFVHDADWLMRTFQRGFRPEVAIIEAEDVLTPDVLQKVALLEEKVANSRTTTGISWKDICFKIPEVDGSMDFMLKPEKSYRKTNETDIAFDPSFHWNAATFCRMVDAMDKECYVNSILDLWGHNNRKLAKLTKEDILNKINTNEYSLVLGRLKNYRSLIGGLSYNSSGHIIGAKSLQIIWFSDLNFTTIDMDKIGNNAGTADWASVECLEWENVFEEIMASEDTSLYDLSYMSARSFGDISGKTMFQDIDILMVGVVIMVIYVQFVISKFNYVEMRVLLGCAGLLAVGMSFVVGCGLCSLFGISYGPVHTSLPFLLMGLGVDDMFVIIACWEQLSPVRKRLPLPERIGYMLKHGGVSITVTTLTDVMAFVIGATTILPCLQSYCIYAAVSVLMTFLFVITFFVACFALDQRRLEQGRNGIAPWIKYKNYKPNECSQRDLSGRIFHSVYSKVILTWPGKLLVVLVTAVCLGFSVESIFRLEQRFDPAWFIPRHTFLGEFIADRSKYFPTSGFDAGIFIGAINYTEELPRLNDMMDQLENSTDIVTDTHGWIKPFREYVKVYYRKDAFMGELSDNEFDLYLSKFLFSPRGARFQANFRFKRDLECGIPASKILMSSVDFRFLQFNGPKEHLPAMRRIMSISKGMNLTTGDKFSTAWSKIFATWITDELIDTEVLRNMGLALVCVMACTLVLIANVQMCFWIFLCVVLSMVNVCGFMQRWGLTIDLASCIGLQLAIGLCVDYATHIGHTFLTQSDGTKNERVLTTVTTIGSAVLYGGLSTLIGVGMLGLSDAYTFQTFFKIFLLVILFGLYHGVVLLPVVLSWIGPKPYYSHTHKTVLPSENVLLQ